VTSHGDVSKAWMVLERRRQWKKGGGGGDGRRAVVGGGGGGCVEMCRRSLRLLFL
jgi:hypothetical protein